MRTEALPAGPSEDEVLGKLADGSKDAVGLLYERYFPRLVRVIGALTGPAAAEDIAQVAFLRVLETASRFDPSRPFWPWLRAIGLHLATDHLRRRGREVAGEPDASSTLDEPESFEEGLLLKEALSHIPARQRVAVGLRYVLQWEPTAAAVFMGVSSPAFRKLLQRARRNLRTEYERLSGVPGFALLPLRLFRRAVRRATERFRRLASQLDTAERSSPVAGSQLGHALLAIAIVVSTTGGGRDPGSSSSRGDQPGTGSPSPASAGPARSSGDSAAEANGGGQAPPDAEEETSPVEEIAETVTDPNRDVRQPEHAELTSIVFARNGGSRHTVYASGYNLCLSPVCATVLFRSDDGGATWRRLPAKGFSGVSLLTLPAGAPPGRLFAIGPSGLQVSKDGGQTFTTAPLAGTPTPFGAAAVSPAFYESDPRILIGGPQLMKYMDDRRTIEPEPSTASSGFYPAFSPSYPEDRRIVIGGAPFDPDGGRYSSTVFVCEMPVCRETKVGEGALAPDVRLAPDFDTSNLAFAFHDTELFVSRDGGLSFSSIRTPWEGTISDVALADRAPVVFAAVWSVERGSDVGLWISGDGGDSWHQAGHRMFRNGAVKIATSGERVLVGLLEGGVACSPDLGRIWAPRCD